MSEQHFSNEIGQIATRIREMRGIIGISVDDMAEKTELTVEQYRKYVTNAPLRSASASPISSRARAPICPTTL